MRVFIILLCFNLPYLCLAQKILEKSDEKKRGSKDHVILQQTIQSNSGKVISIGETTSHTLGGKDGYFAIFNPSGSDIIEKRIGSKKDDVFNSVAALPDGTFLIAGSTKRNGKEQAWLYQIDAQGDSICAKVFDSAGLTAFQTILVADDGSVFLIGSYDDNNVADIKFMKMMDWEVEIDSNLNLGGYVKNIKSAVLSHDGGVVIVGDTRKTKTVKGDDIWVIKIDKKGKVTPFNRYGEANYEEHVAQIIRTADNGFAIVGMTNNSQGKKINAWLLKLDAVGSKQWDENYGGRDNDMGNTVVQTIDDGFLLAGKTYSHNTDAQKSNIYFVKTDASGKKIWDDDDGDTKEDCGIGITPLYDGHFLLTATTELLNNTNSWFYRFQINNDISEKVGVPDKPFSRKNWIINRGKGYLDANSRTFLTVSFTNTSSSVIKNVQLKCESPIKDIQAQAITYLGLFHSGETKTVHIPLRTSMGLEDNKYPLKFEVVAGNNLIEKQFFYDVTTKKLPREGLFFVIPPQYERLNDTTVLKLTVKNTTKALAQNLSVKIELPKGLKAVGSTNVSISSLAANKTFETIFTYQGQTQEESSDAKSFVQCSLFSKNSLIVEERVPALPLSNTTTSGNILLWRSPDQPKVDNQNIKTSEAIMKIELLSITDKPVQKEDFSVFIDGQERSKDSKMDVVDLPTSSITNNQYYQVYPAIIEFNEKKTYTIQVKLKTAGGTISSLLLTVKYDPGMANLYVMTIGTTVSGLKYTTKDASDVADFFNKQPRKLFKDIISIAYTDSIKTTQREIRIAFSNLVKRFENSDIEPKIENTDYLLVFLSSHGKMGNDKQYKILPSDYISQYSDETSIDYQTDILDKLKKINCHKLLFIDACHSGATKGAKGTDEEDAAALMKISQATTGTTIITSCNSDENSYEDEVWKNGAFTEALLEAFTNKICQDETSSFFSDINNNGILTLGEIMTFINRRVPKMVTGRQTEQHPVLAVSELDLDTPLIILKK